MSTNKIVYRFLVDAGHLKTAEKFAKDAKLSVPMLYLASPSAPTCGANRTS